MLCFHKCEICQCRNNSQSTAAVSENRSNLRDHTRRHRLFQIKLSKSVQRICRLLKPDSGTVNQSDHRRSHFHCHVIKRCNLFRMHFSDRSAQHRRILAVYIYQIAIDHSVTGNDAISRRFCFLHVEISRSGSHAAADLNKAACIK